MGLNERGIKTTKNQKNSRLFINMPPDLGNIAQQRPPQTDNSGGIIIRDNTSPFPSRSLPLAEQYRLLNQRRPNRANYSSDSLFRESLNKWYEHRDNVGEALRRERQEREQQAHQERREDTAGQRRMRDLRASGINPATGGSGGISFAGSSGQSGSQSIDDIEDMDESSLMELLLRILRVVR